MIFLKQTADELESEEIDFDDPRNARMMTDEERAAILHRDKEKAELMSPPGALGLSPLLEKQRLKHKIIDAVFTSEAAAFNEVYIWQIPYRKITAPGSSRIIIPIITQDRYSKDGPRGVLISAGAHALQFLQTNGIQIGHTVTFARHNPWRITVADILGAPEVLLGMLVGDIIGSEELCQDLRAGRTRYVSDERGKVYVETEQGKFDPLLPFSSDEAM